MKVDNKTMRLNKKTVKFNLQRNTITFYIGDFSRTYKYNNFDDERNLIHEILLQTFMADYKNRGNVEQDILFNQKIKEQDEMNIPVGNLLSSECKALSFDNLEDETSFGRSIAFNSECKEINKIQIIKNEDLLSQQQEISEINNIEAIKEPHVKKEESVSNSNDLDAILNRTYNIKNIFDVPNDNH